jgi:hypothetical protein
MSSELLRSLGTVPVAGLVGNINDGVGLGAALTGIATGSLRYAAVLRGSARKAVERATAIGFFLGLTVSPMLVATVAVFQRYS